MNYSLGHTYKESPEHLKLLPLSFYFEFFDFFFLDIFANKNDYDCSVNKCREL